MCRRPLGEFGRDLGDDPDLPCRCELEDGDRVVSESLSQVVIHGAGHGANHLAEGVEVHRKGRPEVYVSSHLRNAVVGNALCQERRDAGALRESDLLVSLPHHHFFESDDS